MMFKVLLCLSACLAAAYGLQCFACVMCETGYEGTEIECAGSCQAIKTDALGIVTVSRYCHNVNMTTNCNTALMVTTCYCNDDSCDALAAGQTRLQSWLPGFLTVALAVYIYNR